MGKLSSTKHVCIGKSTEENRNCSKCSKAMKDRKTKKWEKNEQRILKDCRWQVWNKGKKKMTSHMHCER